MSNIVAILLDNLQKIDMSVYEFSKRVGIPKGRIYQWIRGNGSPKERDYQYWQENIAHKLTETRRKEIRRKFEKVITGYKITIHDLTPFHERVEDVPVLIKRKKPKNDL